jgi:uncharacterized membrane protein (DUF2068 family)
VAIFEFIKGSAVLLIGMGLLSLVHHDVQEAVERLMKTLHFDPAWHWCKFLLNDASTMTDVKLRRLAVLAFAYSAFRIIEAYGLWFEYLWAEWLAVISSTIYLPLEIQHIAHRATIQNVCVLVLNLIIIAYLAYVLWDNHRARVAARAARESAPPKTEAAAKTP